MIKNILSLMNQIESHQVNRDMGAGENIIYVYRRSNQEVKVRAFVACDLNDKDGEETRFDLRKFCMVDLENEPMRRDAIKYNGDTYLVESWKQVNEYSNLYDIFTRSHESEMHYRGRRK